MSPYWLGNCRAPCAGANAGITQRRLDLRLHNDVGQAGRRRSAQPYPSLAVLVRDISAQVDQYGTLAKVPAEAVGNTRNDMYLAAEAIRFPMKDKESGLSKDDVAALNNYKKSLDNATKFIPTWVKIAVAIALGLGTMIGGNGS